MSKGIALINRVDVGNLGALLLRIVQKLHLKVRCCSSVPSQLIDGGCLQKTQNESVFTDAQLEQLQSSLQLSADQLADTLLACTYLLQQAAYDTLKPNRLGNQLVQAEMAAAQAEAFVRVWEQKGAAAIELLKDLTLAPLVLSDVHWRLHLTIGQDTVAKRKELAAVLQLGLQDNTGPEPAAAKVLLEMDEEQLRKLYGQLETIQEQLDSVQR